MGYHEIQKLHTTCRLKNLKERDYSIWEIKTDRGIELSTMSVKLLLEMKICSDCSGHGPVVCFSSDGDSYF
jgi:hypothetical protein